MNFTLEQRFWLNLSSDALQLLQSAIADVTVTVRAQELHSVAEQLRSRWALATNNNTYSQLNVESGNFLNGVLEILAVVLRRQLNGTIICLIPAPVISAYLAAFDQYLHIIQEYVNNSAILVYGALELDVIWLPILAAQLDFLAGMLQPPLRSSFTDITVRLRDSQIRALELLGYLRSGLTDFPLHRSYREVLTALLSQIIIQLQLLLTQIRAHTALFALPIFFIDSIARQCCYYSQKLAISLQLNIRVCDVNVARDRILS